MNPFAQQKTDVKEVKQEPEVKPEERSQPTVILTQTDAYIHELARSQPRTFEEVEVKFEQMRRPNVHRLSLPKELDPYLKRFAFRWIFKHQKAITQAVVNRGWTLCNSTLFRDLPKHLFASTGCIEIEDSILAFMPVKKAEEMRKKPGELSRQIINSTLNKHKDNPDFYVPKDSEDKSVIGI